MPTDATFALLVERARALDSAPPPEAAHPCLLRYEPTLRFEGDVAAALTPLPNAWNTFSRFQNAHGAIRVLSRWGQAGPEIYDLAVAAFTSTPPVSLTEPALVIFVEGDRAYVRTTTVAVPLARRRAVLVSALLQEMQELVTGTPSAVYITASAGTTLAQLRAAFTAIAPVDAPIALAVPMAPDTHLPARVVNAGADSPRDVCPDGSADRPAIAREGSLETAQILAPVQASRPTLAACFTDQARESAGGVRYVMSLAIDADGSVYNACVVRESVRDVAVRTCLLNALRALRFSAPSPAGFVSVQLPLRFDALETEAASPICPAH